MAPAKQSLSADEPQKKPHRGAKRAARTRARLVRAAMEVMAVKGIDGANIADITEAADVGVGSFYNHFGTREAIVEAVVATMITDFGDALDTLANVLDDPAEVMSASTRYALIRAKADPAWGWFLIRTGLHTGLIGHGLAQRMARDLEIGIKAGRFNVSDLEAAQLSLSGTVFAFLASMLNGDVTGDDLDSRMAKATLLILGMEEGDATDLAYRPLPALTFGEDDA